MFAKASINAAIQNSRIAIGNLYKGGFSAARKSMAIAGRNATRVIGTAYKNPYVRQASLGAALGATYGLTENIFGEDDISMVRAGMYGAGVMGGWKGFGALRRSGLIGKVGRSSVRGAGRSLRNMLF